MELIDKLREIINDGFIEDIPNPGHFILKEIKVPGHPHATIKYHAQRNFLPCVFDVNNSNDLFKLFDVSIPKVSSICDYILFFEKKKKRKKGEPTLFIFLCNLKSKNRSNSSEQVKASQILSEYVSRTAIRLLKYKSFKIEYRALTFSTSITTRFTTNIRRESYAPLGDSKLMGMNIRAGNLCVLDILAK